jgi:uncharacterized protein
MPDPVSAASAQLPVTSLYAGLCALLYSLLSFRVIRLRIKLKQARGDGGSDELARAVRVHGHFAEYVPLALLLLLLLEHARWPGPALHLYGVVLLATRVIHVVGLTRVPERTAFRLVAMVITLNLLTFASLALLVTWWRA